MTVFHRSPLFSVPLFALALASSSTAFVPSINAPTTKTIQVTQSKSSFVIAPPSPATGMHCRGSTSTTTSLSMMAMGGGNNMFDRFVRVVKANFNNLLKRVEDPEKVMTQAVEDMQTDLFKIRKAYAEVTASQRRLQKRQQQADALANDWYNRAQLALQRGKEDLAREALAKREQQLMISKDLQSQIGSQNVSMDRLYDGMQALERKIVEAAAKKDQMIARAKTAKSTQQVNDMISGITGKTSMDAFNRMEERVLALEAAAEVSSEMAGWNALSPSTKSLEGEFRLLEESSAVDRELRKLKGLLKESPTNGSRAVEYSRMKDIKVPFF